MTAHTDASTAPPAATRQVLFPEQDRIEMIDTPLPSLGPEDLLLRVARVGVCATDLHLLAGHIGDPFPLVPGHEFVGEVAAIGDDAAKQRDLQSGDHIAVEMLVPCHRCARCREGRYNLCDADDMLRGLDRGRQYGVNIPHTISPGLWGGYAEYLYVPAGAVTHHIPHSIPWNTAVLTEPLAVASRAIARGRVEPGNSVVVIGPGPVGILTVAAARAAGASHVVMVGTRTNRLELATRFGADFTINSRDEDADAVLRDRLGGRADVVIEMAGVPVAQQQAVQLARRGGRVVLAGACGSGVPVTFHQDEELLLKEVDLLPSFLSSGGFEPAIELLRRGEFPFAELVSHTFPLADAQRAFDLIRNREDGVMKVALDPTHGALP